MHFTGTTIITNPVLLTEQILITLVFTLCAIPVYIFFDQSIFSSTKGLHSGLPSLIPPKFLGGIKLLGGVSFRTFLLEQETKMRAFAMAMTGLASFLLSFYTAVCVTRWWTMRTSGVGGIKAAVVDLQLLLYQYVTKEERFLSAVQRYGRTSLMLISLWREGRLDELKELFTQNNFLSDEECDLLIQSKHCLHETIWAWQTAVVTSLHKQGAIKSDAIYVLLLRKCLEGRAAAQCIHTHLAVRVPVQYVHLLGLLVKMHNVILAVIMGLLFGAALRTGMGILCVQLFCRTLILPLLFNAILLINCDLSDPFNGGTTDFPTEIYQKTLATDCATVTALSSENLPEWLQGEETA
jgi:hypothetical protein